jgi:LPXTG-motif cell wall-anchored protein
MRHRAALTTVAAGTLLLLGPAVPAAAEEGGATLLSLDGSTFSASPVGAVFSEGLVLIPGSRHTGTVWVRNDSDRAADLRISVSDTTASSVTFIEHLTLQALTPQTTDSDPVALEPGATCIPLLEGELMAPGTVTEVSITLAMRDAVDNAHQGASANTTLMVSLSEPGAPSTEADCTPGGGIPLSPDPAKPADTDMPTGPDSTDDSTGSEGPGAGEGGDTGRPPLGSAGGTAAPTDQTPGGAAAPPSRGTDSPVLFPWMGVGAVVLGGGVFFGLRKRKEHRG